MDTVTALSRHASGSRQILNIPPSILPDGDTARTGRNMPEQSHKAGDRSQLTRKGVAAVVLRLVRRHPLTGAELNEAFRQAWQNHECDRAAYDSPRKRAREMEADGLLKNIADDGEDAVYTLTEFGWDALLNSRAVAS